jgi:hypothetical protein
MKTPKRLLPFMTYLEADEHIRLKKFAKQKKLAMAKIIREAIMLRMADSNPYVQGHNEAVSKCIKLIESNTALQMRFPSGKSFAEMIADELSTCFIKEATNENS